MYKDIFGNDRYKVGLHIHTTLSDGRATPEEAARIYKAAGFDAIAITDHWRFYEEGEIDGFKIISGCEYNFGIADTTVDVMHIVGVGMKREPDAERGTSSRQEVIDAIKKEGGTVILAHPAWSLNSPEEAMELSGIDATEIYNSVSNAGQSTRPYSGYFVDLLSNMGRHYSLVATDDTHFYDGTDETKSYIMVKAKSNSQKDILEAVKRGDFYATQGPEVHIRREGEKIIVDCSECVLIDILSNSSWAAGKTTRGKDLTHAEYDIPEWNKWVRAEVRDENGNYAWSNIIKIK